MVEKWNHVGNIMRIDTVIRFDYECLFFNEKRDMAELNEFRRKIGKRKK